jgi:hypothetical protein
MLDGSAKKVISAAASAAAAPRNGCAVGGMVVGLTAMFGH